MVSAIDRAKRALVTVIKYLAGVYGVTADVNRDSKDDVLRKAYRKVSVKVHPDKGGKSHNRRNSQLQIFPIFARLDKACALRLSHCGAF